MKSPNLNRYSSRCTALAGLVFLTMGCGQLSTESAKVQARATADVQASLSTELSILDLRFLLPLD